MQDSTTSKEKILKKIRKALIHKSLQEVKDVDKESEIFFEAEEDLEIQFAQHFSAVNGNFIFCENDNRFIENFQLFIAENNWKNLFCLEPELKKFLTQGSILFSDQDSNLSETNVGITSCECLIARTGSVILSSKQLSGRRLAAYANIHIVIAYTSQLKLHLKDGFKYIREKYSTQLPSMITTITGPSKTADIEKTLVQGAHGPKEIFVFLIDDI
jgi:L-lactate dehydrogenase complex protein LldG